MTAAQTVQTLFEIILAILALLCLAYEERIALWERRIWRRTRRIMRSFFS